jgi:hypothetical protein
MAWTPLAPTRIIRNLCANQAVDGDGEPDNCENNEKAFTDGRCTTHNLLLNGTEAKRIRSATPFTEMSQYACSPDKHPDTDEDKRNPGKTAPQRCGHRICRMSDRERRITLARMGFHQPNHRCLRDSVGKTATIKRYLPSCVTRHGLISRTRTFFDGAGNECNHHRKSKPADIVCRFANVTVEHHTEKDQLRHERTKDLYGNEDHRSMASLSGPCRRQQDHLHQLPCSQPQTAVWTWHLHSAGNSSSRPVK